MDGWEPGAPGRTCGPGGEGALAASCAIVAAGFAASFLAQLHRAEAGASVVIAATAKARDALYFRGIPCKYVPHMKGEVK